MIDWTKPIQHVDGRPARLVCSDCDNIYSHIVLVRFHDGEAAYYCKSDGSANICQLIVNVPEPPKVHELWLNVYRYADETVAYTHSSRQIADAIIEQPENRIARIKVTFTEGQFDE